MTHEPNTTSTTDYRFETYTDGCDEVLSIYLPKSNDPSFSINYWTGEGVGDTLTEQFSQDIGLRDACKRLLAELETMLASDDNRQRAEAERESELLAGLRLALSR